jgi:hypothetical protein
MAIAYDAVSGAANANVTTTNTWAHTCTGANGLLIVVAGNFGSTAISGVTYGGDALTYLYKVDYAGTCRHEVWYKVAPKTGANNIVITYGATQSGSYPSAGAVSFTGVNQSTPLGTSKTASGVGTTPAVSGISSATGELVIDSICLDSTVTATPTAGQTQTVANGNYGNNKVYSSYKDGAASVDMSWTRSTTGYWTAGGVSIKPAVASGHPTIKRFGGIPFAARNQGVW